MSKSNDIVQSLIRASLGAKASTVADDQLEAYVAKLIAEEAASKRKKYDSLGIAAYTQPDSPRRSNRPNLGYLRNVLKQTESHNTSVLQELQAAANAPRAAVTSSSSSRDSRRSVSPEKYSVTSSTASRSRGRGSVKHDGDRTKIVDSFHNHDPPACRGRSRQSRHHNHSRSRSRSRSHSPQPTRRSARRDNDAISPTHTQLNSSSAQSTRESRPRRRSRSPLGGRDRVERKLGMRDHDAPRQPSHRPSSSQSKERRRSGHAKQPKERP
ncbi:hypothetical protein BCR44DRAFT_188148 [Catenaria anguillulae PL171]|uniref:Uncharacterized protein n=1 Tax=Catenaria anguillulae PL171 TaxID=765915 RepID=A0A1Y2HWJ2_9FUNG|nr:hypothetical protein BCR44DRAFT_188148 [Catenaria anguillulae PL171]